MAWGQADKEDRENPDSLAVLSDFAPFSKIGPFTPLKAIFNE